MEKLVIVGSGPAGLSAALLAAREGAECTILSKNPEWIRELAEDAEITPPSRFVTGYDILKSLGSEVVRLGIGVHKADVRNVGRSGDSIVLETESGPRLARSAIIATGRSLRRLGVKGESELQGKGVSHWPAADAEKYRGAVVAVVCGPDSEPRAISHISRLASKVYLIGPARGAMGSNVKNLGDVPVREILGKSVVHGIFAGNETIEVDAVFVLLGLRPNSELVSGCARLNPAGEIIIDRENRTSVEGLFAAGDVTDVTEKQILVALGEGAKAAHSAISYACHSETGYEAI